MFEAETRAPRRRRGSTRARGLPEWRTAPVQARPGFLIRRLHQIHTALFAEETAPEKVTPVMYSVLSALDQRGAMDQTTLARAVAIDKANMADILERMRKRGLVGRRVGEDDRRVRVVELTEEGHALLTRLDERAERAHARTIEPLDEEEQRIFLALMARIVDADESAAPSPRLQEGGERV